MHFLNRILSWYPLFCPRNMGVKLNSGVQIRFYPHTILQSIYGGTKFENLFENVRKSVRKSSKTTQLQIIFVSNSCRVIFQNLVGYKINFWFSSVSFFPNSLFIFMRNEIKQKLKLNVIEFKNHFQNLHTFWFEIAWFFSQTNSKSWFGSIQNRIKYEIHFYSW